MSFDSNFSRNYQLLNAAQRSAVDRIDGPVMVVAGPGTGKTQLLAMRVGNILQQTDTEPGNILCLTFTESAAANMTERMAAIFGPTAYQVSVNTFHGLGSEIIGRYSEHFYNGAIFQPADELTTGQIIQEILAELPHSNPLSKMFNDQFTYLNKVTSAISHIKRAGLLPHELQLLLEQNLAFCHHIAPQIRETFADRISKKTIPAARTFLDSIETAQQQYQKLAFVSEPPLANVVESSLRAAVEAAELTDKTSTLTAWKRTMLETDDSGDSVLRDQKKTETLASVNVVYEQYLKQMDTHQLYDYDDMILRVIHTIENVPTLKAELQEKYQYILVDEFQDTNDSQMRLLWNLTDYDDQPNIMVVGDDDQAIFRFQGADISNIQSFRGRYTNVETVILTENYRSGRKVLDAAGDVARQINERLSTIFDLEKNLIDAKPQTASVRQIVASTAEHENSHITDLIQQEIAAGQSPASIAVIARRHSDLMSLLPFLAEAGIPVTYERENDVLSSEPIAVLEHLTRVVVGIAGRHDDQVDALLPELLSHPAWQLAPQDIWQISLAANREHKYWLETLLTYSEQSKVIGEWLIQMSAAVHYTPLETMLDQLFDSPDRLNREGWRSPLYRYFFSVEKLATDPTAYLSFLSSLTTLRQTLRGYRRDETANLTLPDFLLLIDAYRNLGKRLVTTTMIGGNDRINLLTVHKSKGMEFDSVYLLNASSNVWGQKSRSNHNSISFPINMPFQPTGDTADEQLRLLFVAMTRAKRQLTIGWHQLGPSGKPLLPLEYLIENSVAETETLPEPTITKLSNQLETAWHAPLTDTVNLDNRQTLLDTLADRLARYRLSATDLNRFIDLPNDGPQGFLMRSLLRFPSAMSAPATFGTVIHATLQRAHTHVTAQGHPKPLEDVLGDFETLLRNEALSDRDFEFYLQKGVDDLKTFYAERIQTFQPTQIAEHDFYSDNIIIGQVRLTGKIDLIDIDKQQKTITVTDYKTGKAPRSWQGRTDYEKIKLHKYRQQLMFYKLLVERSPRFKGYTVTSGVLEFVEPIDGVIRRLELDYDQPSEVEFLGLVTAVWPRIMNLELPDITEFSADMAGILAFEQFLRENS
ncbi:MAG: ATP-dependent helicase [Sphaerimonospora mesophila]